MEIKSRLAKPYSKEQRIYFIVSNNHKYGYEIKETETELQAWGKDSDDLFIQAKENKISENELKADNYRYNQEFIVTIQDKECLFDTKEKTQNDLNTATNFCLATGGTYDGWITNNGIELNLTLEDISIIGRKFKEKADVYSLWKEYQQAIEKATTIEELNNINIKY